MVGIVVLDKPLLGFRLLQCPKALPQPWLLWWALCVICPSSRSRVPIPFPSCIEFLPALTGLDETFLFQLRQGEKDLTTLASEALLQFPSPTPPPGLHHNWHPQSSLFSVSVWWGWWRKILQKVGVSPISLTSPVVSLSLQQSHVGCLSTCQLWQPHSSVSSCSLPQVSARLSPVSLQAPPLS